MRTSEKGGEAERTGSGVDRPLRFLFALPGFHSEERGAEVALLAVADRLARSGDHVTVIGTGPERPGAGYAYRRAAAIDRRQLESLPRFPPFRSETVWEDATFAWWEIATRYRAFARELVAERGRA